MQTTKDHYADIERVIEHMVQHKLQKLSLSELAHSLNMSAGHMQKIFTQWVGVTPKQFGRYVSLQYAKELLAQNATTTQTAVKSGLSGSGRLHDLFVDIEAMTPGEYQNRGANLAIRYSVFQSPFGLCLVASTSRGISNVLFSDTPAAAVADLKERWQHAAITEQKEASHEAIKAYITGITPASKIKLHLHGTNFQLKVWEALLSIPEGRIASYGDIAEKVGDRKLSRIVGGAIGSNPVGYIIPCHRVLKATGEISGYRWGVSRKRAMLCYEALQTNGD